MEKIMDDRLQHFAAHPYYLMGLKQERLRILEMLSHEWDNYCANDKNADLCTICAVFDNISNQVMETKA